jgi:hypothetical protein
MTDEQKPFMDYWLEVDAALLRCFGINSSDAGIDSGISRQLGATGEGASRNDSFLHRKVEDKSQSGP